MLLWGQPHSFVARLSEQVIACRVCLRACPCNRWEGIMQLESSRQGRTMRVHLTDSKPSVFLQTTANRAPFVDESHDSILMWLHPFSSFIFGWGPLVRLTQVDVKKKKMFALSSFKQYFVYNFSTVHVSTFLTSLSVDCCYPAACCPDWLSALFFRCKNPPFGPACSLGLNEHKLCRTAEMSSSSVLSQFKRGVFSHRLIRISI